MTNTRSSQNYYVSIVLASVASLISVSVVLFQIGTEWWFNFATVALMELGILSRKHYVRWMVENGWLSVSYVQWLSTKRISMHKNMLQYRLTGFPIGDAYAYQILDVTIREKDHCRFTSLNGFSSSDLQLMINTLETTPKKQDAVNAPQAAMKMKTADL